MYMESDMKKEYYTIGVTGHRDLLPSQEEENLTIIKGHLLKLLREHKDKELLLLTPLADGADRVVTQAAYEVGITFDVILPMPKELYCQDFSKKSQKEFIHYLKLARNIETIPMYAGNTLELIAKHSTFRDFQYRQVGRTIVDRADEMIIMSDGIENDKMGGTSDIAKYAKIHGKILFEVKCDRLCA